MVHIECFKSEKIVWVSTDAWFGQPTLQKDVSFNPISIVLQQKRNLYMSIKST